MNESKMSNQSKRTNLRENLKGKTTEKERGFCSNSEKITMVIA